MTAGQTDTAPDSQTGIKPDKQTDNKRTKPVSQTRATVRQSDKTATTDKPDRQDMPDESDSSQSDKPVKPDELAEHIYKNEGKYPSIRRLAGESGISRYKAEKILKQLNAQAS